MLWFLLFAARSEKLESSLFSCCNRLVMIRRSSSIQMAIRLLVVSMSLELLSYLVLALKIGPSCGVFF